MSHLDALLALSEIAQPDYTRAARTGVPEVILADRKSIAQNLAIAAAVLEHEGRVILSRVSPDLLTALQERFPGQLDTETNPTHPAPPATSPATVVVRRDHAHRPRPTGGQVGVLTAGTSDIPVAAEAVVLCRELGCQVQTAYDVGVAGLHRLQEPLRTMTRSRPVDVLIVAAGMDGALPSVVAGLVEIPVIGLPTSVGYGLGGNGVAALLSMLQSCAPGLAVVNIDNGIGAGAMAARIANRAATHRNQNQAGDHPGKTGESGWR
ncbi:MAG: nickel pincer cofactor biosynthesis protein LarB [Chloroflexaceae bacterium]|nr:nickel pincer cofactor biosynthesis protein LarB [Chloroflexaceae bacterium]